MTNHDKIILSRILTAQNAPQKKARDKMTKPLGVMSRVWRGMGTLAQKAAKGYFDQGPTPPPAFDFVTEKSRLILALKKRKENDR